MNSRYFGPTLVAVGGTMVGIAPLIRAEQPWWSILLFAMIAGALLFRFVLRLQGD